MSFDERRLLNLTGMKRFIFLAGFLNCFFMTYGTGMRENIPLAQTQKVVQLGDPVAHVHRFTIKCLQLGHFRGAW